MNIGINSNDVNTDQSWRKNNIGRLLKNSVRRFEKRILQLMEDAGQGGYTLSHVSVTRNLDLEGTRTTKLAKQVAISKQSIGELITQLEGRVLIKRQPEPHDKHTKNKRKTESGFA